jgi:DME family drug/metabolite transporter
MSSTSPNPLRPRLELAVAALLFSTGGAAMKSLALPALEIACLRSLIAGVALLALVPASRRLRGLPRLPLAITTLCYAATVVLFVYANTTTTAANAIFLQSTAPIWVVIAGPLLLKESVRRADFVFLAALVLGLALLFAGGEAPSDSAPDPAAGNLAATLSGLFWAATLLGLRALSRHGDRGAAPAAVAFGNLLAAAATAPLVTFVAPSGSDWLLLAHLGVVQIGLAYYFLTRGIAHVPAFEASLLLLIEPVFNPLFALLFHGEVPGPLALAGCATILLATILRSLRR